MPNFITCLCVGHLTRDPEVRETSSGPVTHFAVAVNSWRESDETLFMECDAWGKLGQMIARNFAKGKCILVQGELRQRAWTDNEGATRKAISLNVREATFGDSKAAQQETEDAPSTPEPPPDSDSQDFPF